MRGTWQTTSGGGGGGSGALVFLAAAVLLLGSGAASAIASAVTTILVITGVVIVLAAAGIAALLVYRARPDRPGRPIAARPVYQLPPEPRPQLEESSKPAIGPPRETHLHFHVSAAELAAIMRQHYTEGEQ